VVVWNVERLLYPNGSRLARALNKTAASGWDFAAYRQKIDAIAAMLVAVCPEAVPAIVILIEVENAAIVRDLIDATGWQTLVDVVPADERVTGYDVCVLYDSRQICSHRDAASYSIGNRYSTRDIVDVTFDLAPAGSLRLIALHWASRKMSNAEPLRIAAAWFCYDLVERIMKYPREDLFDRDGEPHLPPRAQLASRWATPLVIVGDFNDNPWDTSVRLVGNASYDQVNSLRMPRFPTIPGTKGIAAYLSLRPRLFNPTWSLSTSSAPPGSLRYNGDWYLFDQFLLSPGLVKDTVPRFVAGSLSIQAPRTITMASGKTRAITDKNFGPIGFDSTRSAGVSDHLPLIADFEW